MEQEDHHDPGVVNGTLNAVCAGLVVGGIYGVARNIFLSTLNPAEVGESVLSSLSAAKLLKSAAHHATTFALVAGVFQGAQSSLNSAVGKSAWNSPIAGCATGFALGVRVRNTRTALASCAVFGAAAAAFSGFQVPETDERKRMKEFGAMLAERRADRDSNNAALNKAHKGH